MLLHSFLINHLQFQYHVPCRLNTLELNRDEEKETKSNDADFSDN